MWIQSNDTEYWGGTSTNGNWYGTGDTTCGSFVSNLVLNTWDQIRDEVERTFFKPYRPGYIPVWERDRAKAMIDRKIAFQPYRPIWTTRPTRQELSRRKIIK